MLAERESSPQTTEEFLDENPLERIQIPLESKEEIPNSLKEARIIRFNQKLYILDHIYPNATYAYEYFTAKLNNLHAQKQKFNYDFSISWDNYKIENYSVKIESAKHQLFTDFMKCAIDLSDKSEAELYEIHKECLHTKIIRKLQNTPSLQMIKAREDEHRNFLREKIMEFFYKISPDIYKWADEGSSTITFTIVGITENNLTSNGTKKAYINAPCYDGVHRPDFKDYVYYLLGDLYPRHADETDAHLWIGSQLADHVRKLFPHLCVVVNPKPEHIIPQIIINLKLDTTAIV